MDDPLTRVADLPGVADAVEEARTAVDRLRAHRVLRRSRPAVSAESALRGARASAALEGAEVPLDRLRDDTGFTEVPPILRGALRVTAELSGQLRIWPVAPRQVLARLHTLAAAAAAEEGGLDPAGLGRPRGPHAPVSDPAGLGAPPPAAEVPVRLDALAELLTGAGPRVPALVVAAIVHGELLTVRPFGWGDGLVARAAQRLTLIQRGLDPAGLVVAEVGHLDTGGAYPEAARGYATGTAAGVAGWVAHCARAVALGARESLAVCAALERG